MESLKALPHLEPSSTHQHRWKDFKRRRETRRRPNPQTFELKHPQEVSHFQSQISQRKQGVELRLPRLLNTHRHVIEQQHLRLQSPAESQGGRKLGI